jgi:anti-sigma regulatory factor (Ser/Thr protein kinase)
MSASEALSRSTAFDVAGGLDASAAARHVLRERYRWPTPRVGENLALMLGEVVTNAVIHGGIGTHEWVRVAVVENAHTVTFSVYDPGPGFVPAERDPRQPTGGFGLMIVEALARRWGVAREGGQTRVWFEAALA